MRSVPNPDVYRRLYVMYAAQKYKVSHIFCRINLECQSNFLHVLRDTILVSSPFSVQEKIYFTHSERCFHWIVLLDWFEINISGWQAEDEKAIYQYWKQAWDLIKPLFYITLKEGEGLIFAWSCLLTTHVIFHPLSRVLTSMSYKHENNNQMLPNTWCSAKQ